MTYRHTQRSRSMMLISVIGVAGVLIGLAVSDEFGGGLWWFEAVMVLLVAVGLVGSRLTVTVDDTSIEASFGWGWPRRRIALAEIADARPVRNSWWHGWGIRKVRGGWMYNNAGRDAIELTLVPGRVFRIGTDQPDDLLAAIDAARRSR